MREEPRPPAVYAIADAEVLPPGGLAAAVAELAQAGVGWIQVRAKRLPGRALYHQLERCCRVLEGGPARLWIDDRVDLALLFPVAGVHLGQRDLPPAAARALLGAGMWIGRSTHDRRQLVAAAADPDVDVVALGPIFPTTGKERPDPVVGLAGLAALAPLTRKPLVAIGGVGPDNLLQVLRAGAASAAVLGAVCRGRVGDNAARLLRIAEEDR